MILGLQVADRVVALVSENLSGDIKLSLDIGEDGPPC